MIALLALLLFGGLMYVGSTRMGNLFDESPPLPHQTTYAARTKILKGIDNRL